MHILIVGGGLVGSTLAGKLSQDGHDISLVDSDAARVRELADSLDVQVTQGNGALPGVLRRAGIAKADVVVAATSSDEVNLVVTLLASSLFGVSRIVARIHDAGHGETFQLVDREHPAEPVCVNPDEAAVDRIAALFAVPGAVDVNTFMEDQLLVAGFRIKPGSDLGGLRVSDMNLLFAEAPTLAVAIHRGDDWIIPHGEEVIQVGDLVYFAIARDQVDAVQTLLGVERDRRRDVMIAGAGGIGLELARRLQAAGIRTVLIEPDRELAEAAAEELTQVTVVCGRPTDQSLLEEEEVERVSTFVAVTPDHEVNLVAGLLARRLGVGRTVVLVDNPALVELVGQIGLDAIISPRVLTIGLALEKIRGGRVRSVAQLLEDRIEIVEAEAVKQSRLTERPLSELKLPRGLLAAAFRRGEKLRVPRGADRIEPGDRVLFITTTEDAPKLADFLED
jgi:trk system potassium uptake protein TrkA